MTNDVRSRQFQGTLLAIGVAEKAKEPMRGVDTIVAIAGSGLTGDRYATGLGASQRIRRRSEQQVTLISAEAIAAAAAGLLLPFEHLDSRRNLLTRDVPLNDLVGERFWIGEVQLQGVELCEPCNYLQRMTQLGIKQLLAGRGGLRAEVLTGGVLTVGDTIRSETELEREARREPIAARARQRRGGKSSL